MLPTMHCSRRSSFAAELSAPTVRTEILRVSHLAEWQSDTLSTLPIVLDIVLYRFSHTKILAGQTSRCIWQTARRAHGEWGPRSAVGGLSGAEEAVLMLSQQLAKQGKFHIEVCTLEASIRRCLYRSVYMEVSTLYREVCMQQRAVQRTMFALKAVT